MSRHHLAAAFILTLLTAATAAAQDARATLERKTRPGDLLTIDVRSLGPVEGRLVRLEPDGVHIESGSGIRPVAYGDIDRVRRRRNGATLGTAIGAGAGLVYGTVGAIIGAQTEDIGAGGALAVVAMCTAAGTAIGWAIDKAISLNRTVYRRAATTVGFALAPRPGGAAASVTARW